MKIVMDLQPTIDWVVSCYNQPKEVWVLKGAFFVLSVFFIIMTSFGWRRVIENCVFDTLFDDMIGNSSFSEKLGMFLLCIPGFCFICVPIVIVLIVFGGMIMGVYQFSSNYLF